MLQLLKKIGCSVLPPLSTETCKMWSAVKKKPNNSEYPKTIVSLTQFFNYFYTSLMSILSKFKSISDCSID